MTPPRIAALNRGFQVEVARHPAVTFLPYLRVAFYYGTGMDITSCRLIRRCRHGSVSAVEVEMDLVSATVLAALASGAGGEMGRQAWAALTSLVRSRRRSTDSGGLSALPTGEQELDELEAAPADSEAAARLAAVLRRRAEADDEFAADLTKLLAPVTPDLSQVNNLISGTVAGTAIQGRDFHGPITFT